jgi:hypothetical protein
MKSGKTLIESKTFWVNFIALVLIILNHLYPTLTVTPEAEGIILVAINWLLRIITGDPIVWRK